VIRRIWDFGDGFGCDAASCMYQYREPGIYQLTLEVENEYCKNVIIRTIQVINTTNRVKTANQQLVFKVYPNPAGSAIEIRFDENRVMSSDVVSLAIYNPAGQPVQQLEWKSSAATERIHLPHLPTGIYQVVLRAGDQIGSQSLVIQQN
jgi:PKD repeat protein